MRVDGQYPAPRLEHTVTFAQHLAHVREMMQGATERDHIKTLIFKSSSGNITDRKLDVRIVSTSVLDEFFADVDAVQLRLAASHSRSKRPRTATHIKDFYLPLSPREQVTKMGLKFAQDSLISSFLKDFIYTLGGHIGKEIDLGLLDLLSLRLLLYRNLGSTCT